MKLRKEQWIVLVAAGLVILSGIRWGLPDRKRMELLTPTEGFSRDQIDLMNSLRGEFSIKRVIADSIAIRALTEEGILKTDFKKNVLISNHILSEKNKAFALRGYILGSGAIDEMSVPQSLGRMNPSKLDFDPKSYIYGGAFLYPIGAAVFAFRTLGLFTSTTDFSYYLKNPGDIALLYLPGRLMNLFAFLGTLAILAVFGTKLAGRLAGTTAMLAYLFSTLPMGYTAISKPHVYSAFWALLAVYLLYLYTIRRRKKILVFSAISAGIAFSSSFPVGIISIIYPVILFERNRLKKVLVETLFSWITILLVFTIFNPYALINYDKLWFTIVYHGSREGPGYAVFSIKKMTGFMTQLFVQGLSFPLSIAGLAAMFWYAFKSQGFARRLAWIFILFLFCIGSTLCRTRISMFLCPVICLFSGLSVELLSNRIPVFARRIVYIVIFLPSLVFLGFHVRDFVFDDHWIEQTENWIRSDEFNSDTTIGVFSIPAPVDTPPFPFINCTLINMNNYNGGSADPKYVIVGNYSQRAIKDWNSHPIRYKYDLAYNLGYRKSYEWMRNFRMRTNSQVSGFVYRLNSDL
ncbi:MAG: hypothetical protein JW814_02240 [Candidatus Krumholzibacteriota bacterium]|nr:hypothetical protein [Candidatus Krumholzibacteriota bacterium]